MPGVEYHATSDKRSFAAISAFLAETFEADAVARTPE